MFQYANEWNTKWNTAGSKAGRWADWPMIWDGMPSAVGWDMTKYDDRQTAACDQVREHLRSIIVQAQEGLDKIGSDALGDLFEDIARDVRLGANLNAVIATDRI